MSSISMDAPTLSAHNSNIEDFIGFLHKHESLLKYYGAIKIVPTNEFQIPLKKKRIRLMPPSTIQQVTQLKQDTLIYSVDTVPCVSVDNSDQLPSINENTFWLSLCQSNNKQHISNVSIIPKASYFLKRIHRADFDIHRLPHRSLLRLCDNKLLHQFVPSLIRTHGPGAIFPLSSAHQRLFSFNYHHEGGPCYWYIIPSSERDALQRVLQQQMASVCIDHGHVLIDPLMLDRYKIRYHRIVQHPNEIVVIAAGALSQNFTGDATWSETVEFALPSWLDDGHASAQLTCKCKLPSTSLSKTIDIKVFIHELVERYISNHLNNVNGGKSISDTNQENFDMNDTSFVNNNLSISFDPSSALFTPSISSDLFEDEHIDDNNYQQQSIKSQENTFLEIPNNFTYLTRSSEYQSSLNLINEYDQISSTSTDFYEQMIIDTDSKPHYLSFQEIMDIVVTPPATVKSVESQTEDQIVDQNNDQNTTPNSIPSITSNIQKEKTFRRRSMENRRNGNRILCVSGLKKDITQNDLRRHFIRCIKVVIKKSRVLPYLCYAFIYHRTNRDAEYNRKRSINYHRLGFNCHVEYANNQLQLFDRRQNREIWNVVVKRIPENITEEYLGNLFLRCHSMMYVPARRVNKIKSKVLYGYAFLYYTNTEEAVRVVQNADRYKINNHSLLVSFFDRTKTSWEQRKTFNCIFN